MILLLLRYRLTSTPKTKSNYFCAHARNFLYLCQPRKDSYLFFIVINMFNSLMYKSDQFCLIDRVKQILIHCKRFWSPTLSIITRLCSEFLRYFFFFSLCFYTMITCFFEWLLIQYFLLLYRIIVNRRTNTKHVTQFTPENNKTLSFFFVRQFNSLCDA